MCKYGEGGGGGEYASVLLFDFSVNEFQLLLTVVRLSE